MSWLGQIGSILQQYSGNSAPVQDPQQVHDHFDQVANNVPSSTMAGGLSDLMRSQQTGGFGETVANLFSHSNGEQRAGLLNQLLASGGPAVLSQLGGLLGNATPGQITPEQAQQIAPQDVKRIAEQAHAQNPSVVDEVSGFYAQHPTVVKALGVAAVGLLLRNISLR